ncbi:MAG: hypothetical protein NT144_13640 [Bacteroidia bacterium]|nr:hypothetical protein [Bacteroidia bacterium]
MKKKVLFGLGALAILAMLTFNVSLTKDSQNGEISLNSIETVAVAQAEDPPGVNCNCPLLWGTGCKADNYGATCAPDGTTQCWLYDRNCAS